MISSFAIYDPHSTTIDLWVLRLPW